ncbi:hypothetical protein ACIBG6_01485 [Streptomyces sp. NPDC050842]|uniref:hypothetical protein n=1 Tax=Streptomyces sp. NPDC050842 TaxID=3365636 RepID=UPI00378C1676
MRLRGWVRAGAVRIDALKVARHGRANNFSNVLLDCGRYLISTNGKVHGHPRRTSMVGA